jgi:hypothetical protein
MTTKESLYQYNLRTHSYNDVWKQISNLIPTQTTNTLIVNAGIGYLVKYLIDHDFKNIKGINAHPELTLKGIELCKELKELLICENFFRLTKDKLKSYECFVFAKTLEYLENDKQFLKHLPTQANIILTIPNYDDGLTLTHFSTDKEIRKYFENEIENLEIYKICLYKNMEFMIDQAVFVVKGNIK